MHCIFSFPLGSSLRFASFTRMQHSKNGARRRRRRKSWGAARRREAQWVEVVNLSIDARSIRSELFHILEQTISQQWVVHVVINLQPKHRHLVLSTSTEKASVDVRHLSLHSTSLLAMKKPFIIASREINLLTHHWSLKMVLEKCFFRFVCELTKRDETAIRCASSSRNSHENFSFFAAAALHQKLCLFMLGRDEWLCTLLHF